MRRINSIAISIWVLVLFTFVAVVTVNPSPAGAVTHAVSLTATPAVLDTGGEAGNEVKVAFRLKNNADAVLPIRLSARDPQVKNGQSQEEVEAMSAASWIAFTQPDFVLQANETKKVEATLRIPEDASPGGHYADLVASPLSLESDEEFISAQPELVVQMLVSVPGEITEEIKSTLSSRGTIITSQASKEELTFDVTNHGNIHTLFQPRVYLSGKDSEEVIELNPVILLPKEARRLSFSLPGALSPGIYSAEMRLDYGTPPREETSQTVQIIILPFSPILLLGIPLAALILYGIRIRRRVLAATRIILKGK